MPLAVRVEFFVEHIVEGLAIALITGNVLTLTVVIALDVQVDTPPTTV